MTVPSLKTLLLTVPLACNQWHALWSAPWFLRYLEMHPVPFSMSTFASMLCCKSKVWSLSLNQGTDVVLLSPYTWEGGVRWFHLRIPPLTQEEWLLLSPDALIHIVLVLCVTEHVHTEITVSRKIHMIRSLAEPLAFHGDRIYLKQWTYCD